MMFGDHEKICERNSRPSAQQMSTLNETLHAQSVLIQNLSAEIAKLTTAVAVLRVERRLPEGTLQ